MATIDVVQSFTKEDLICTICLEYLNKEIYQCPSGPHYTCLNCSKLITECPICRAKDKMVRLISLEQAIQKYLIKCNFFDNGCNEKIFEWDTSHKLICKFRSFDCPVCNKKIENKHENFINHLMDGFCKFQFAKSHFSIKKPKFKCTIVERSATVIEIVNRYLILIIPHFQK